MSQGKAKKKLNYHQGEDKCGSQIKIKEVFTLRGIDSLFDSIDADSELGLPMLSQLPKNRVVIEQKGLSDSDDVNAPSEQAPKEAVIEANGIHGDEIIDKESPFKEIAPIKTSSPITLAAEGDEAMDGIRPMADPLLFGEDEELIGGDLGKPGCTQQSKPVMAALNSYSGSLESPPERLEFRKTTKPKAGSLSSKKTSTTSLQATQSAPMEIKKDLSMDKDPSSKDPRNEDRLSPVLVQKNEQKRPEGEQCMDQVVEDTGKGSLSFQHKLKKALMHKSPCSRKTTAAPAPLLVDLEEDFMILDDEAPVLFVIPRKTEVSRTKKTVQVKTSKESLTTQSTAQPLQSETEVNDQQEATSKRNKARIESGKKQPKGNRRKASKKTDKDAVTDVLEQRANSLPEALEDRHCDQISQNVQQSSTKKAPDESADGAGEEAGSHQIPVPPVARKTNKSTKSSGSQQERPGSKAKKESNTKVGTTKGPHSTNKNRKNIRKGEALTKTNRQMSKRQMEPEQIDNIYKEHDSVESSPALDQQEEEQRTAVSKPQSSTRQDALKDPAKKQKTKETKRIELKPKDLPPNASDTSSDSPMLSRRKRKPPGSWWLTGQDDSATEGQSRAVAANSGTRTPTKQAAVKVSGETQSSRPAKSNQKKRKTSSAHSVVDNATKLDNARSDDAKAEQKAAKKTGGQRRKAATQPQVPSPIRVSEEEIGATLDAPEEIGPAFSSQYRQHKPIPGEKQVFDKIYTRDHESAQKHPSSLRRPLNTELDDVPVKRHRKNTSNWWKVPQSQDPSPPSPPSQKPKPTNAPIAVALNKEPNSVKSQKTKNIKRNIISTPKSIKRSLASMNAIFTSEKHNVVKSGQRRRKQGRRNILHSLEDQSDHSSENMAHSDDQMQRNGHVSSRFISGAAVEPAETRNQTSVRVSSGPNTLSDVDVAFRSGPSSMLELQRHDDDDDDVDLPSSRVTPIVRHVPRVLSQCDLCGPPLKTIVLEEEDWNNLQAWFSHLWPPASKEGRVVSPDDFHWHSYGGRAMGHAVDLQGSSFSHGKILLGSFMKKPPQMDLGALSVYSIISSCVRVDIEGVKSVYNSGQVFMIPSGQEYSIHNLCQEPAVLIYHRTQSNDTQC